MGLVNKDKEKDVDDQVVGDSGEVNYKTDSQYGKSMNKKIEA